MAFSSSFERLKAKRAASLNMVQSLMTTRNTLSPKGNVGEVGGVLAGRCPLAGVVKIGFPKAELASFGDSHKYAGEVVSLFGFNALNVPGIRSDCLFESLLVGLRLKAAKAYARWLCLATSSGGKSPHQLALPGHPGWQGKLTPGGFAWQLVLAAKAHTSWPCPATRGSGGSLRQVALLGN
eukprot:gene4545-14723_t